MKQTRLLAPALLASCFSLAAVVPAFAATSMTWENKWYPVPDGKDDKVFIRFGTDNNTGQRCRQWANGYDHKVKITGRVYFQGAGPGQPNPNRTFYSEDRIPLGPNDMSDPGTHLAMEKEPYLGAIARIEDVK